ncbi:MAG: SpoIID/LytB domain-containing protein [Candidatus Limnocylindrales bacterium]
MPSANPAVGVKPVISASAVRRRVRNTFLAAGLGLGLLLPAGLFVATGVAAQVPPGGGNDCSRWTSTTTPPDYIRVYRNRSGRIERVPFRKYVVTVLGREWPGYLPHALIAAGAVAAKQYAWYHALSPRHLRDGRCFDVRDGIQDQLYRPGSARIRRDHFDAVDLTWDVTLLKGGRFFMTGYRAGHKGRCGSDANGWKLFARTGTRCANGGKDYMQILRIYYGPDLNITRRR